MKRNFRSDNAARAAAGKRTAHIRHFILAAMLFAGCDGTLEPPREVPTRVVRIEAVTPTDLTGTVMSPVTPVPTVGATNEGGRPVWGVGILFDVGERGGVIASDTVYTDSLGLASVGNWMLDRIAGPQNLTVSFSGRTSVVFRAWANAGPASQMWRESGNGQVAAVGETLAQPLRVKVVDRFYNPVANSTMTFTVISGEGRIEGNTVETDASGIAESGQWTLSSPPGVQQVRAQSAGKEVVFSAFACESCNRFLLFERDGYIYRAVGNSGQEVRLTEGFQPAWSPDGQRIAFARSSGGRTDIYLMAADGSNIIRRTSLGGVNTSSNPGYHSPSWSPDGRKLAVATGDGVDDGAVYILSTADDGTQPVLLRAGAAAPVWSPDGSKIAFVRVSWSQAVDVMNADGSDVREVVHAATELPATIDHLTWSPDGRRIVFAKGDLEGTNVYSVGSDGSALTRLTSGLGASYAAWSLDGAWIAFTLWTGEGSKPNASIAFVPADTGGPPFTLITSGANPAWQPGPQKNWR